MSDPTWVSILPPVIAIVLAIWTRQVYLSLAAGVWMGWMIVEGWNPLSGLGVAIEQSVAVLASAGNANVILFTLVIGALIATIETSGGVRGFVHFLETREWVNTPRRAQLLAWVTGVVIFIESNITVLVAGSVSRPLFDRYRISREKLAYIIDTTSAAVCILIPLNAWGAYNLGILDSLGVEDPLGVFVGSIPLNFYALAALFLALVVIIWNIDLGPMKRAEKRTQEGEVLWPDAQPMIDEAILSPEPDDRIPPRARNMIIPIVVMVLMMPVGLWITGDGDLRAGSGATSVLWAVMAALASIWVLMLSQRGSTIDELTRVGLKGAGGLVPLALILLLALALGDVAGALGTGAYVAQVTEGLLPPVVFLPLIFLVSAGIAFSTGTSWGTFAIMLPIAVPAAMTMGWPLSPFVAAVLSGGIFGDHSSPISDTTIISSMASATDHIDHVRTQLPYASIAALVAVIGFALVGLGVG
ncbi:MAG: C4-dicarboxylate ABC transporter [Gemmatimonadales bacterium]|nr:MAG: C4-dicarboxylate ABC transporter [Gemmatimonadales bacterium]